MDDIPQQITFRVNLQLNLTEEFGPKTNLVNPHMLSPDRFQSSQDNAILENANRKNTRSWLPEITGLAMVLGGSPELHDGDEFTLTGKLAYDVKKRFATGTNAILTVVA